MSGELRGRTIYFLAMGKPSMGLSQRLRGWKLLLFFIRFSPCWSPNRWGMTSRGGARTQIGNGYFLPYSSILDENHPGSRHAPFEDGNLALLRRTPKGTSSQYESSPLNARKCFKQSISILWYDNRSCRRLYWGWGSGYLYIRKNNCCVGEHRSMISSGCL